MTPQMAVDLGYEISECGKYAMNTNNNVLVNHIYHESCLETLQRMDDKSVGVVVTSPPYNMNLRIMKGKYQSRHDINSNDISTKYEGFTDNLPIDEYFKFHYQVLKELIRVSDLVFYNVQIVTGSKRAVFKLIGELSEFLKDIIVWDKKHGQPAMKEQVLNRRSELILVFDSNYAISRQFQTRGNFKRGTLDDVWEIGRDKKYTGSHGAVFPQELVKKILTNFSEEGDVIYDPFMGTGTTGVAAQNLSWSYIGYDIDEDYVKFATQRLNNVLTHV